MVNNPISQSNQFEFNDSVLTTKAWNSSRYDGRQLSAQKLNKISKNDVGNNNKTPIIRNYTRNIYIGNEIVGMNTIGGDDSTLIQFPDFSYAQINTYITVNEDGTLTRNTLDPEENNNDQKKAFYRPFVRDFAEGSFCNFILGDPTVKNNLKSKYPIYFNGGQLKKLLTLQAKIADEMSAGEFALVNNGHFNGCFLSSKKFDSSHASISGAVGIRNSGSGFIQNPPEYATDTNQGALYIGGVSNVITTNTTSPYLFVTASGMKSKFSNEDIYNNWFTGSIDYDNSFLNGLDTINLGSGIDLVKLVDFSQNLINYKTNSTYKGDKRFFITATKYHDSIYFDGPRPGNPKPLYTFEGGNVHTASLGIRDINLSSLTTLEVDGVDAIDESKTQGASSIIEYTFNPNISTVYVDSSTYFSGSADSNQNEQYPLTRGKSFVPNLVSGSLMFSISDDDVPSILIPLKKERDLPEDKGEKPFVVIPENLHPYVKDNLIFYLSKAGIDIGGNATDQVEEDLSKKPRLSKLSPKELKLLALQRVEQNRRRREVRETSRRDRRRAISRREDKEERRKKRVENRQERRKNRKDKKENRQENRQNRKNRRKNRRKRK